MPTERFRALDDLRVFVVFLVVALHAALTYMVYAPPWWYVLDPQRSLIYTGFVLIVDVPIMLVMFFLAGYFARPSLDRRGAVAFLREKAVRIGIPWVFGAMVLAPPTAWIIYWSRGAPVTLLDFWRGDFWGIGYQQSIYWFLGVLFVLFLAVAAAHAFVPAFGGWTRRVSMPPRWLFAAFVAVMTVASFATGATLDTWSHNWVLVYQPARVPLYIGYFALGLIAERAGWFCEGGYRPAPMRWTVAMAVCGAIYLAVRMVLPTVASAGVVTVAGFVFFNIFCFTSLFAGVAVFSKRRRAGGAVSRSLARNAYAVYYLHPLILYPLALALVPLSLSVYLKAALLIALGYVLSLAASALVLTRLPGLRRMF